MVQKITRLSVNRRTIPEYAANLPLQVEYGNKVGLKAIQFHYEGPSGQVCICWAPKPKHWVDFNNGDGIPGGPVAGSTYGYAPVAVDSTPGDDLDVVFSTIPSATRVEIKPSIHIDPLYDTWVWAVAGSSPSTDESLILVIDTDADVIEISGQPVVSSLEVGYAVVP